MYHPIICVLREIQIFSDLSCVVIFFNFLLKGTGKCIQFKVSIRNDLRQISMSILNGFFFVNFNDISNFH